MTTITLNPDIVRTLRIPFPYDGDPANGCAAGGPPQPPSSNFAASLSSRPASPSFSSATNTRSRQASRFYMTDHRVEGPGHPPVYIPESQNIENEFSFWPRYDEFVTPPRGTARPDDAYYTEEQGVNLFEGRNALFITEESRTGGERPPTAIERGFERVELVRLFRIERRGEPLRDLRVFACYNYRTISL